jgi:hypothetical protein
MTDPTPAGLRWLDSHRVSAIFPDHGCGGLALHHPLDHFLLQEPTCVPRGAPQGQNARDASHRQGKRPAKCVSPGIQAEAAENDLGPLQPVKFITTLHPAPALESGQNRASPMNVRDHHSISRGGEVLQCLAPSRVSLMWMDHLSIGMRRNLPAIGSSTDRGVGIKMRKTEGSISWSRVLHRSI